MEVGSGRRLKCVVCLDAVLAGVVRVFPVFPVRFSV